MQNKEINFLEIFGINSQPPLFVNINPNDIHDPLPPFEKLSLKDIRSASSRSGKPRLFKYVILQNGELIISPTLSKLIPLTSKEVESFRGVNPKNTTEIGGIKHPFYNYNNEQIIFDPESTQPKWRRIPLKHPEIAGLQPVIAAGDFYTLKGQIAKVHPSGKIGIDNWTGHYLCFGDHLPKVVEHVFAKSGFHEAKGSFHDITLELGKPKTRVAPKIIFPNNSDFSSITSSSIFKDASKQPVNKAASSFAKSSNVLLPVSIGLSASNLYSAEDKLETLGEEAKAWALSISGGMAGSVVGSPFGPVGATIGAVVGGIFYPLVPGLPVKDTISTAANSIVDAWKHEYSKDDGTYEDLCLLEKKQTASNADAKINIDEEEKLQESILTNIKNNTNSNTKQINAAGTNKSITDNSVNHKESKTQSNITTGLEEHNQLHRENPQLRQESDKKIEKAIDVLEKTKADLEAQLQRLNKFEKELEKQNAKKKEESNSAPKLPQHIAFAINNYVSSLCSLRESQLQTQNLEEKNRDFIAKERRLNQLIDFELDLNKYKQSFSPASILSFEISTTVFPALKLSITQKKENFKKLAAKIPDLESQLKRREGLNEQLFQQIKDIQSKKDKACLNFQEICYDHALPFVKAGAQLFSGVTSLMGPITEASAALMNPMIPVIGPLLSAGFAIIGQFLHSANQADQARAQRRIARLQNTIEDYNVQLQFKKMLSDKNSEYQQNILTSISVFENEVVMRGNDSPAEFIQFLETRIRWHQTEAGKDQTKINTLEEEIKTWERKHDTLRIELGELEIKRNSSHSKHEFKHLNEQVKNKENELNNVKQQLDGISTKNNILIEGLRGNVTEHTNKATTYTNTLGEANNLKFILNYYHTKKVQSERAKYEYKYQGLDLSAEEIKSRVDADIKADKDAEAELTIQEMEFYEALKGITQETHHYKDCITAVKQISSGLQRYWGFEKPGMIIDFIDNSFEIKKILDIFEGGKDGDLSFKRLKNFYDEFKEDFGKAFEKMGIKNFFNEILNPSVTLIGCILNGIGLIRCLIGNGPKNPILEYMEQAFQQVHKYLNENFQRLHLNIDNHFKQVNEKMDALYCVTDEIATEVLDNKWQLINLNKQLDLVEKRLAFGHNVLLSKHHTDFTENNILDYGNRIVMKMLEIEHSKYNSDFDKKYLHNLYGYAVESVETPYNEIVFDDRFIDVSLNPHRYIRFFAKKLGYENATLPNFEILYASVYRIFLTLSKIEDQYLKNEKLYELKLVLVNYERKLQEVREISLRLKNFLAAITNNENSLLISQIKKLHTKYSVLKEKIDEAQKIDAQVVAIEISKARKGYSTRLDLKHYNFSKIREKVLGKDNGNFIGEKRYLLNDLLTSELALTCEECGYDAENKRNTHLIIGMSLMAPIIGTIFGINSKINYTDKMKKLFLKDFVGHFKSKDSIFRTYKGSVSILKVAEPIFYFNLSVNKFKLSMAIPLEYSTLYKNYRHRFYDPSDSIFEVFQNFERNYWYPGYKDRLDVKRVEEKTNKKLVKNSDLYRQYPVVINPNGESFIYGKKLIKNNIPKTINSFSRKYGSVSEFSSLSAKTEQIKIDKENYDKIIMDYLVSYSNLLNICFENKYYENFNTQFNGIRFENAFIAMPSSSSDKNLFFPLIFADELLNIFNEHDVVDRVTQLQKNNKGLVSHKYSFIKRKHTVTNEEVYSLTLNYYLNVPNNPEFFGDFPALSVILGNFSLATFDAVKKVVESEGGFEEIINIIEVLIMAIYGTPLGKDSHGLFVSNGTCDLTGFGAFLISELGFKGLYQLLMRLPFTHTFYYDHNLYTKEAKKRIDNFVDRKTDIESIQDFLVKEDRVLVPEGFLNLLEILEQSSSDIEKIKPEFDELCTEILSEYNSIKGEVRLVAGIDNDLISHFLEKILNISHPIGIQIAAQKGFKSCCEFINKQIHSMEKINQQNVNALLKIIEERPSKLLLDLNELQKSLDRWIDQCEQYAEGKKPERIIFNRDKKINPPRWEPPSHNLGLAVSNKMFKNSSCEDETAIGNIQNEINNDCNWEEVGDLLVSKKNYFAAINAYRKVIQNSESDASCWYKLASAQYQIKDYQNAAASYLKVTELKPNDAFAWNKLGNSLLNRDIYGLAENCYRTALEEEQNNAILWFNLGLSQYLQKKYGLAEGSFRRAEELDPNDPYTLRQLSILLYLQGEEEEAQEYELKADELDELNNEDDQDNEGFCDDFEDNQTEFLLAEKQENTLSQTKSQQGENQISISSNPNLFLAPSSNKVEKKLVFTFSDHNIVDVSGFRNSCGLFALVLGTKMYFQKFPGLLHQFKHLSFISKIEDSSLKNWKPSLETVKNEKLLRSHMKSALQEDNIFKKRRYQNFVALVINYLQSDYYNEKDMESFYLEENNDRIINNIKDEFRDFLNALGDIVETTENCLKNIKETKIPIPRVNACKQFIDTSIKKLNHSPTEDKAVALSITILNEFKAEDDLIKFKKLWEIAWQNKTAIDFSEGLLKDTMYDQIIGLYVKQLEKSLSSKEDLLLFAFLETIQFDNPGEVDEDLFLDNWHRIYVHWKLNNKWESIYQNYCNYVGSNPVFLSIDELICLGNYWGVQVEVSCNNRVQKSYKNLPDPKLPIVKLVNPSERHWQVKKDDDDLQVNLANESQLKSWRC